MFKNNFLDEKFHVQCCLIYSILEEAVAKPWEGVGSGIRLVQLHGTEAGVSQSSRQKSHYSVSMAEQHGLSPWASSAR